MDHQPRSSVCAKKKARDRLICLAGHHPDWALGFADETWWSRVAHPQLHAWAPAPQPLRLIEQTIATTDADPKALACYGLLLRWPSEPDVLQEEVWLRFVEGRPVSAITTAFLAWSCRQLTDHGKRALLLIWDNAPWHRSQAVRAWIRAHNHQVKRESKPECTLWSAHCRSKARG